MAKAIGQIRVSTLKQAQHGTSYENQEIEILRYCKRNNINLVKLFKENGDEIVGLKKASGANLFERTDLLSSLDYLRINPDINCFICYKLDRFTRNFDDYRWFVSELYKLKVKLLSVTETFEETIEGEFWQSFTALMADKDRKETVRKLNQGQLMRYKQGYWANNAFLGFMKEKTHSESCRRLIPDPERYELIKKMFEKMLTGRYTVTHITDWLNEQGFKTLKGKPVSRSVISHRLKDIKYTGFLQVKNRKSRWINYTVDKTKAEWYEHRIIEPDDFFRLQIILQKGKIGKNKKGNCVNGDYLLAKTLRCSKCGRMMSGYSAKGRKYYKCKFSSKEGHDHYNAISVEKEFQRFLENMKLSEEFRIGYIRWLNFSQEWEIKEQTEMMQLYDNQLKAIETKICNIEDLAIEGILSKEKTKIRIEALNNEYLLTQKKLEECKGNPNDVDKIVEKDLFFLENFFLFVYSLEPNHRAKILSFLFPNGLIWQGKFSNLDFADYIKHIWILEENKDNLVNRIEQISNSIQWLNNLIREVKTINNLLMQ